MTREEFAEASKDVQQEELEKDMLEYLENGGKIEFIEPYDPPRVFSNIAHKDRD